MVLPDVLSDNLDIIFCGSAVGEVSARRGMYYAGQGNSFWQVLNDVGLTPRQLAPNEYEKLIQYRLGLTDLVKCVSGNDEILSKSHFDSTRLNKLILKHQPKILAFTGKRPAKEFLGQRKVEYGKLEKTVGRTLLFVLPSPSGAARRYWSKAPWQELSELRKELNICSNLVR